MVEMEQLQIVVRRGDKYIKIVGEKAWKIVSFNKLDKEVTRMLEQQETEDRKNAPRTTSDVAPTENGGEVSVLQVE